MQEIINEIASNLLTLKEDKPYLIITDEIIKDFIEEDIDKIVKLVKEELEQL